jgi:hypothetical protein
MALVVILNLYSTPRSILEIKIFKQQNVQSVIYF